MVKEDKHALPVLAKFRLSSDDRTSILAWKNEFAATSMNIMSEAR